MAARKWPELLLMARLQKEHLFCKQTSLSAVILSMSSVKYVVLVELLISCLYAYGLMRDLWILLQL